MDLKVEHKSPFIPGPVEPWEMQVGHPIEAISLADLRYRKLMCVVRLEKESYLFLAKTDHSEWGYNPLTGSLKDFFSIPIGFPSDMSSYSQLNVLLVDDSGTMRLTGDGYSERKIKVVEKWITCFLSAVEFYNIPSVYGACSTNGKIPFALPSRLPRFGNLEGNGSRGLWDSFNKIVNAIDKSQHNLRTRIFIITDGIDVSVTEPPPNQKLLDLHIIVDAFVLHSAGLPDDITEQIKTLCWVTGGYAFAPDSPEKGLAILRKEAFIDIRFRKPPGPVAPEGPNPSAGMSWNQALKPDLHYKFVDPLRTLESLPPERTYRARRIVKEMTICNQRNFRSFCSTTSIDEWRTFLKAKLCGWQKTFFWDLLIAFPPGYPHSSPIFRFRSIPPAEHVGDLGLVRLPRGFRYHPRMRVVTMLDMIRLLLVKPEKGDFLDDAFNVQTLVMSERAINEAVRKRHFEKPIPIQDLSMLSLCKITNASEVTEGTVKSVKPDRKFSDLTWQVIEMETEVVKYGIVVGPGEVNMLPE
jgi:ubiquitin-protein ligase